jgi:hypothetical protein
MMKPLFVWLGSRRTRKHEVGDKCRYLDQATSAGLPVPSGAILLDELYRLFLAEEVIEVVEDTIRVPDPGFLYQTLYAGVHFPKIERPVVVRAAFSWPNSPERDPQGTFAHRLTADLNEAAQLAEALAKVWSSAFAMETRRKQKNVTMRRDVLVMEAVDISVRGWVTTRQQEAEDALNVEEGEIGSAKKSLSKLRPWRSPDKSLPAYAQRLQQLMRGVRRTFGKRELRVDWIDDGRICWITQVSSQGPSS